jgi:hypothetical protein
MHMSDFQGHCFGGLAPGSLGNGRPVLSSRGVGLYEGTDLPERANFRKASGVSCFTGSVFFVSFAMECNLSDRLQDRRFGSYRGETVTIVSRQIKEVQFDGTSHFAFNG